MCFTIRARTLVEGEGGGKGKKRLRGGDLQFYAVNERRQRQWFFSYRVIQKWNLLPLEVKTAPSLHSWKKNKHIHAESEKTLQSDHQIRTGIISDLSTRATNSSPRRPRRFQLKKTRLSIYPKWHFLPKFKLRRSRSGFVVEVGLCRGRRSRLPRHRRRAFPTSTRAQVFLLRGFLDHGSRESAGFERLTRF